MTEPITPTQATDKWEVQIPDEVIEAFNELIVANLRPGRRPSATINMSEITAALKSRGIEPNVAFDRHWLDVESLYGKVGWKVTCDQPGYNKTGRSCFTFEAPRDP